jgi:drug/metabolite transporter (DMT)-like permease
MRIAVGTAVALCAAAMFGLGIVIQAHAARAAPASDVLRVRLLARLLRSQRFLAGVAAILAGWLLQVIALLLAPLTVVQPALAATVVVVLVLARRLLDEPVGRRETLAAAAIVAGIAVTAAVAPDRTSGHAGGGVLLASAGVMAAVGAAPIVARRSRHAVRWVPVSAGVAFALASIATKLVTDAGTDHPFAAAAWLAVTALASAVGGIDELSALRAGPAVAVVPVVFATETLVPVITAPVLFGEHWAVSAGARAGLVLALAAVAAGVVALGRTHAVSVWMEPS